MVRPEALDAHSMLGLGPGYEHLVGLKSFVLAILELQPSIAGVVVSESDIILAAT